MAKALSIQAHPDRDLARPKKNGLDYLFHLYGQCRVFLLQVQTIAKMGGHKSPTKNCVLERRQRNTGGNHYSDETGSIDAITFSFVAEELVERSAYLTSQNMKIDPLDHVTALDKAIGKTKLFKIGMNGSETSTFAIKYVLKKCFDVNASGISITVPDKEKTPPLQIEQQKVKYVKDATRSLPFQNDKEDIQEGTTVQLFSNEKRKK